MGNNVTDTDNNRPSLVKELLPTAAGGAAGVLTLGIGSIFEKKATSSFENFAKEQQSNNSIFRKAAVNYMKENGIDYGDLSEVKYSFLKDIPKSELQDELKFVNDSFLVKILKNRPDYLEVIQEGIKGKNACALRMGLNSKIYANLDESSISLFHEIGHCKNNNKFLVELLHLCRTIPKLQTSLAYLAFVSAILPDIKESDENDSKSKNFMRKALKFLNKNCVTLGMLSFLPEIAEEYAATAKGNKLAKGLLDNDMYKNVVKHNKKALMTYIVPGIAMTGAIWAAKTVNDTLKKKIANPQN